MATIVAAAGGGGWGTTGAWVGGVIPTAADDVVLTATSGNISVSATGAPHFARSLDCTGYTAQLIHSAAVTLSIGDGTPGTGNVALKLSAGMTYVIGNAATSRINFVSTSATQQTVTTSGKTLATLSFQGAGSSYVLADALTINAGSTLFHTAGTFSTSASNFAIVGGTFDTASSTARTLTLGSSALTFSGTTPWNATTITNLTVTANTAVATFTSSTSATFNGGGKDWNGLSLVFTNTTDAVITGTNTVANLTRTGSATIDSALTLAADQTITGTFTPTGNAAANRLWVRSSVPGTARTLTVNTTVTASRVDFEDIVGAGSASWNLAAITDGSGDMGGNSGITFTTAATKFGKAAGNWSAVATWALTSGGAAGAPYPLPQDDVVLDANTPAGSYSMNMQRHCRDLTCTGFTGTLTLGAAATQRYIFGSLTLTAGMTFSATGNFTFAGRGSHTIDMAGKAFAETSNRNITIGRFNGTYTLLSNASFGSAGSTNAQLITGGGVTFAANGFNVTASLFTHQTATINMGSGIWNCTCTLASTPWTAVAGTTINPGTSTIVVANASANARTFAGGGKIYNDLTYTVAGSTGQLNVTGSNTFRDINFSDATNARSLLFTAGTTTGVTGTFNVNGTAGKLMTIGSTTAASHGLAKMTGTVSVDYTSISFSSAAGGAAWYAGANSVNGGNNTGWIFSFPAGGNFFMFI